MTEIICNMVNKKNTQIIDDLKQNPMGAFKLSPLQKT